jgi:2-haloalkanoic acid dehalogenase type II
VVGLPPRAASELLRRWSELRPWPEVGQVLGRLSATHRLAVATNCSEELARRAAAAAGADFGVVVSAERAGWYKPRAEVYRLTLAELGVPPARALFVAGSAYDVGGAAAVGMPVFWHNRAGLRLFDGVPPPLATESTLWPLLEILTQDV